MSNTILAEIAGGGLLNCGDAKVRLREIKEGNYNGLYLEIFGGDDDGDELSAMIHCEPDELRDLCEQISRALDQQDTGTSARSFRPGSALNCSRRG